MLECSGGLDQGFVEKDPARASLGGDPVGERYLDRAPGKTNS
jgi:hypothetical protein